jgi:hypothetical protein
MIDRSHSSEHIFKRYIYAGYLVVFLNFFSVLKLLGLEGIPQFQLLTYRLVDFFIILSFFVMYRGDLAIYRPADLFFLLATSCAAIVGLVNNGLTVTLVHDYVIYMFFFLKVVLLRKILSDLSRSAGVRQALNIYGLGLMHFSFVVAVLILFGSIVLTLIGFEFYFQAHAEIVFAVGLALLFGSNGKVAFGIVVSLIAGKRAVFLGLISAYVWSNFRLSKLGSFVFLLVSISLVFYVFVSQSGENPITEKIITSLKIMERAFDNMNSIEHFIELANYGRYLEFVSILNTFDWNSFVFGHGLGFRYELDASLTSSPSLVIDKGLVTNAHFSPIGLISKVGVLFTFILSGWFYLVLFHPAKGARKIRSLGAFCLVAMLVQSVFAYSFFVSFFTPLYIALLSYRDFEGR